MRRFVAVIAVLGVLWLAVELIAPGVAESRIEERAALNTRGASAIEADVRSFPMVTRLLLTKKVRRVTVSFEEVLRQRLTYSDFRITLVGTQLDRKALLNRDVEIEDIDEGSVTARLTYIQLADVFGPAQQIGAGGFEIHVRNHELVFGRGGEDVFSAGLPDELFPCSPDAALSEDAIVLSCTFTEVPGWLVRAANTAA